MRIYLVRHGESLANVDREIHKTMPDHAISLSEKRIKEAKTAGIVLKDYFAKEYDYVGHVRLWTSPYKRTRETAKYFSKTCSPIISSYKEHILLCEQQFGLFDGIQEEELPNLFPNEHAHYKKCEDFEGRFWARMPLGESRFDVATRVHQAFGTFIRDREHHNIKDIIIICHGVTLRAFVMMWCHLTPEWFDEEPNPKNGSIRLIENGIDKEYIWNRGVK